MIGDLRRKRGRNSPSSTTTYGRTGDRTDGNDTAAVVLAVVVVAEVTTAGEAYAEATGNGKQGSCRCRDCMGGFKSCACPAFQVVDFARYNPDQFINKHL